MKVQLRQKFKSYIVKGVKIHMEAESISGKLVKPDGVEQYWWNGVNYHNVLPEQLIDAVLASEKMEDRNNVEIAKK